MSVSAARTCEWVGYIDDAFSFVEYPQGSRVLDVGFGTGHQMTQLRGRGCRVYGLEIDDDLAARGQASGFPVCRAAAEGIPFSTAAFDGAICKVVIPYTDEARAVAEIARVLRPGGIARISYHGLGYNLRYVLTERNWKRRVYGARVIANTVVYRLTGRRLRGFWGDTVYQSEARLHRYYQDAGLRLVARHPAPGFLGAPVFIYHVLERVGSSASTGV